MSTEEFWKGSFGDDYIRRNRVAWRTRLPFWQMILEKTGARSAHEFGCGSGWNIYGIRRLFPDVSVSGTEINFNARVQCRNSGLAVVENIHQAPAAELVFTSGVLIHIAPEDLHATMKKIVEASTDYVLAIEYPAEFEEQVIYRGEKDKLWKRNYGKLYEDMGLTMIVSGVVSKTDGFDDCKYWLLKR